MAKRGFIEVSENFSQFEILAIHSSSGIASMAWTLDNAFATSFWLTNQPLAVISQKKNSEHVCYFFESAAQNTVFWLVANHGSDGFLSISKPKPDFFVVSRGENNSELIHSWSKLLNSVSGIELAYMMNETAKEKMKWILWLQDEDSQNDRE